MNQPIVAYSPIEAALTDLTQRYQGITFEVATAQGLAEAKAAYKDINTYNLALEAARKDEKEESLARGRFIDSEARRISVRLDALRMPIKALIETETKRAEREREAAIKAEQERIAAEEAAKKKAEEERLAKERAEIAKARAELDARAKAESERLEAARLQSEGIARAAREKIEAEAREARMRIEEQERAARAAREEADRAAQRKRDEEEARLKVERDKLEAERRAVEEAKRKEQSEADAKAKAIRDAEESRQREVLRQEQELMDGIAMLETFKKRFGARPEFAAVMVAIDAYLEGAVVNV